MCYKQELQKKNANKLTKSFEKHNIPEFIRDYFTRLASRASRINYYTTIKTCISWFLENNIIKRERISEITTDDIANISVEKMIQYFEFLKNEKEILLTTLETNKRQLSSFWEYLLSKEYVKLNIVNQIKSADFKAAKTNRTKLTKIPLPEDIEFMIQKINKKPDEFIRVRNLIILRVLRGSGLRESELAGLDMQNLFLDNPFPSDVLPHPHVTVISKGNYDYSEKGTDIVWLTKDAVTALKEWLDYRKKISNLNNIAVFINKNGKRLNERNIQDIFKKYSDGKITPHMIRHEVGTRLAKENPLLAQEILRHKSANTTNTVYISEITNSHDILENM